MSPRLGSMVCVAVLAYCASAHAELYSYTDRSGVIHFTNVGKGGVQAAPEANTYLWEDEEGALQRLHPVEIGAFDNMILSASAYYALPPALIKAVIAVESNFDPHATSAAGAQGLMQLMPLTATEMFVRNTFDPSDNIFGGARYLRVLTNRFGGDLRLTVAAYNAGPDLVERVHGVPNIVETQSYVRRVLVLYRHYLTTWKASHG